LGLVGLGGSARAQGPGQYTSPYAYEFPDQVSNQCYRLGSYPYVGKCGIVPAPGRPPEDYRDCGPGCSDCEGWWARWDWKFKECPNGCWSHHNLYTSSSLDSECTFFFGSPRSFFGEACRKGPPPPPVPPARAVPQEGGRPPV